MEQAAPQNSTSAPVLVANKPAQQNQLAELLASEQKPTEGGELVLYHKPPEEKPAEGSLTKAIPFHPPAEEKASKEVSDELVGRKILAKELGLKVLWPPADSPDADKVDVDVVAIHGIGVEPGRAWSTKTGFNWLKEESMLPSLIPNARIMAFGYNSIWFGEDAVQLPLASAADNLLSALRSKRKKRPSRPLVFICHCFGGLVVQKALCIAKLHDKRWPGIYASTTGVVFLGTPHRGTGTMLTTTVLLEAIARARKVHSAVLNALHKESEVLTDLVNEFTSVCSDADYALKLYCFFETMSSKVLKIVDKKRTEEEFVVDRASGTLHGYEQQGLPLDHFSLNKFDEPDDNNFERVSDAIQSFVEASHDVMKRRQETMGLVPPPSSISSPTSLAKPRPRGTLFQSPLPRDSNFVGRKDILQRIEQKFEEPDRHRVALCGHTGTGKTYTASEYAYRYIDTFPDAKVLWISAQTAEQFEQSFKNIGILLGITGIKDPQNNPLSLVKRYLSQEAHGQWLMVIDGVDDPYTVGQNPARKLKEYLPISRTGSILITTSNRLWASELVKISTEQQNDDILTLSALTKDEATLLVRGRLSADAASNDQISDLVEALNGSSIALAQAAAYIQNTKSTVKDYLTTFKARAPRLSSDLSKETTGQDGPLNTQSCAVRAFEVLFEYVQKSSPESAELLQLICIFDLQFVRRFLLNNYFSNKRQVADSLAILVRFELVTATLDDVSLTASRLVQQCTRAWLKQENHEDYISQQALGLLAQIFPSAESEQWETCDILYPFAQSVLAFKPSPLKIHDRAQLVLNISAYHSNFKRFDAAAKILEDSLKLQESGEKDEALVEKTKQSLKLCNDITQSAKEGGGTARTPGQNLLLASKRASALNKVQDCMELSKPFMDAERLHEVEAMSQEALQECEASEALGVDHEDTIKIADSLAIAYQGQGRYAEALAVHQRILTWCEKNRSKNHLDTLRQKYNIALVYDCQGQYQEAERLYREALAGAESNPLVGPNHPEALRMLCSLAAVLDTQGHSADAEKMFEKAREGQEEQLGYYHPDTLLTLHNLAISAQGRNDLNEAEERFLEVLEGQERTLGANHSATLRTLGNLAFNYQLKGENQKAENCYQLALEGQAKRLGEKHPDTIHTKQLIEEFHKDIRKRGLEAQKPKKVPASAGTKKVVKRKKKATV
ncbi:hypothetical protein G7Y89_g2352 [Cudoniella acicularis]|uniref:NB-ARC domain-containing protein n=1 Tax=Cudoniella acicularis TaxID=354080 RepID=A0A8H4W9F9_9HELO|nr:hypothetical protein G7Y89_g2352 [Cudoniella acicularis]